MCFHQDLCAQIQEADQRAELLRRKAKEHHDARVKELPSLQIGDIVRIQNRETKIWEVLGEIEKCVPQRWSYMLRTESGRLKWRNRKFLCQQDVRVPKPRANPDPTHEDRGLQKLVKEHPEESENTPMTRSRPHRYRRAPTRYGH
ncbi:hypothetical protein TCAL_14116 [Tigriopus californicus]|uniref:Uncharacterized protein n=1 Tax=Tigriopus californicus TaxID=6832 RepID=A0A553NKS8_TIGCA|nr:hypothetical protein TCAL_14116 [Tigriopus californicus]|eukprot:TCALIF_14116-PA protein Name:"Protein of unknown function" AED:0.40 eAED:0.40 QI:0/-1/0/1/-1/1/1/0/144